MSTRRRSARRTARATSTSTTSTCSPATAPAGRCARCCTRASTACRARSSPGRPSTCPARSARSSTSSARCRTSGPARRRSAPSTPTWRPSSARTTLAYAQVRQCIQELIYNLNVPSRWGTQTPFTNLTFDWTCPEDLREQVPVIGGEEMPFTYGELQAEMDMINRAYIEVMTAGDAKGRVFTFPIPTYNITPGLPLGSPNADAAVRDDGQVRPALLPELHQLRAQAQHGALDVLPPAARPARAAQARQRPVRLRRADRLARRGHHQLRAPGLPARGRRGGAAGAARRAAGARQATAWRSSARSSSATSTSGLFPYTKRYLGTLRNHFSTLGVNGINEMIRNFTRRRSTTSPRPWGHAFAVRLLDHVRAAHGRLPGGNRPPLQPGSHAGRRHHLPLRQGRPEALPRHPAGRHRRSSRTTPTRRSCRSASPTTRSRRWSGRRSCSASTPAAPCCTSTWARRCRARRPAGSWCAARWSASACPTSPSRRPSRSARRTATWPGEHEFCPSCDDERLAKKRRQLTPA